MARKGKDPDEVEVMETRNARARLARSGVNPTAVAAEEAMARRTFEERATEGPPLGGPAMQASYQRFADPDVVKRNQEERKRLQARGLAR